MASAATSRATSNVALQNDVVMIDMDENRKSRSPSMSVDDSRPASLREMEVRIFSRTFQRWVNAEVMKQNDDGSFYVEYVPCYGYLYGKSVHPDDGETWDLRKGEVPCAKAAKRQCGNLALEVPRARTAKRPRGNMAVPDPCAKAAKRQRGNLAFAEQQQHQQKHQWMRQFAEQQQKQAESEEPEEEAPEQKVGESDTAYQQRLYSWIFYPPGEEESSDSEQEHP